MRKYLLLIFVFIIIVVVNAESNYDLNDIKIGDWAIKTYEPYQHIWQGTAHHEIHGDIYVDIFFKLPKYIDTAVTARISIDGIGPLRFGVILSSPTRQHSDLLIQATRKYLYEGEDQYILLTHCFTGTCIKHEDYTKDGYEVAKQTLLKKTLEHIDEDPAIILLKEMLQKQVILARYAIATGNPTINASIDGRKYTELSRAVVFKRADYGWKLPARPSQSVTFRVTIPGKAYVIGTKTSEVSERPDALQGLRVTLSETESTIGEDGSVTLEYGKLNGPQALELRFKGFKSSRREYRAYIFLRWGRPIEEWLDKEDFPLASKLDNPTSGNCIKNLLQDLEASYDLDLQYWRQMRGSSYPYLPKLKDVLVLKGLNLKKYEHLKTLKIDSLVIIWFREHFSGYVWRMDTRTLKRMTTQELAERMIIDVGRSPIWWRHGPFLWEDLTSYREEDPSGWHSPHMVYGLAVLWEYFPRLRDNNPLERILDYWVTAIAKRPDPVKSYEKACVEVDTSIIQRGFAIAAFHISYKHFKKPEYKRSQDILVDRMHKVLKANGSLVAMQEKHGWCADKRFSRGPDSWRATCDIVANYGQICAYIDHEGLKTAQEWIKAALAREGDRNTSPFRNYETATFSARCGMIAVMQDRPVYLQPPDEIVNPSDSIGVVGISVKTIKSIVQEIMKLKSMYPELSEFSDTCISYGGLKLHYKYNVVDGIKGTVLGDGDACEIVVHFSEITDGYPSSIVWGNYVITYPHVNWQVSSYPACFWIEHESDSITAVSGGRFGGRFVRSNNIELCEKIHNIVMANLNTIEEVEKSH